LFGCRHSENYYSNPEDEDDFVAICKRHYWVKRPKALEAYHGSVDDDHYWQEQHVIELDGKWRTIATSNEYTSCALFCPRND
jgi:hypothetical protein